MQLLIPHIEAYLGVAACKLISRPQVNVGFCSQKLLCLPFTGSFVLHYIKVIVATCLPLKHHTHAAAPAFFSNVLTTECMWVGAEHGKKAANLPVFLLNSSITNEAKKCQRWRHLQHLCGNLKQHWPPLLPGRRGIHKQTNNINGPCKGECNCSCSYKPTPAKLSVPALRNCNVHWRHFPARALLYWHAWLRARWPQASLTSSTQPLPSRPSPLLPSWRRRVAVQCTARCVRKIPCPLGVATTAPPKTLPAWMHTCEHKGLYSLELAGPHICTHASQYDVSVCTCG